MACHSVDIYSQGVWAAVKEVEDPELRELADKLPNTILHSRANSTVKKYLAAYKRWKSWAKRYGMPAIPAKEHHVGLYLQHLADTVGSKSAVEEACNSLAWVHSTAGLVSPSASPFVKAILEGLQRSLAKPVVKKAPMTVAMLQRMVEDAKMSGTLTDLRLTTACLLSFAGFLRFSELVNIRPCDISVYEEYIVLHIPHSKGDQLRKGEEVVIARCGSATCPVSKLEEYIRRTQISWRDQRFLFRPICKTKLGDRLRESGSISYTCLHRLFKNKLRNLGYDPKDFGLHSMRVGGATKAANAGVPDRLFKRHGRWKSENAKDGYIEDSLEHRLSVTKQLGL
ncbi:integrase/recombinase xerD homolog isoform X1 [Dysidea avara]|uniref:integrase/recombinase xerD homolog isoform X1 n=1 Tax=Dysidea avara TaxID=196820 RepID=UPI003328D51C